MVEFTIWVPHAHVQSTIHKFTDFFFFFLINFTYHHDSFSLKKSISETYSLLPCDLINNTFSFKLDYSPFWATNFMLILSLFHCYLQFCFHKCFQLDHLHFSFCILNDAFLIYSANIFRLSIYILRVLFNIFYKLHLSTNDLWCRLTLKGTQWVCVDLCMP